MSKEYDEILAEAAAEKRKQAAEDEHAADVIKGAVLEALKQNKNTLTKDEILNVKDRAVRQRLIKENLDLFK